MSAPEVLCRLVARPSSPVARRNEPVTFGVPLPEGRVHDAAPLVVVSGGPRPTDARVVERWPDGSIRWALVDTRVDLPPEGVEIHVRDDVVAPAIVHPLTLAASSRQASATSGDARLELDLDRGQPFAGMFQSGRPVIDARRALVSLLDAQGQPIPVRYSTIEVEHAGALRVVLRVTGEAAGAGGARLRVRLRLTVLAGLPVLGVELGLHNPRAATHPGGFWELGDAGSVLLRSAALEFPLPGPARVCRLSIARGQPLQEVALPLLLTQHSSGGEQWASAVHVSRDGGVPLDRRGYVLHSGGAETAGLRAAPLVAAEHDAGVLYVTSERFWEVFPKSLELGDDAVMRLASLAAGPACHEVQGGERSDHEVWIGWGADGVTETPLEWRRSPAAVLPDVRGVAEAEGLPALELAGADTSPTYEALVAAAVDGVDTFIAKRERIDEYGWRHFGDLYADHENGLDPQRRIVSHYNNQYDAVHGLTLQALRHDDHRWWQLARDLAWHVARIDIYWTAEDRAAYCGGLFWHTAHYVDAGTSTHRTFPRDPALSGGGPSNEHCYSNGLLLHHLLTGDPVSREAVMTLAEWVLAMDDGRRAKWPLPWLSAAPTGGASATASADYHGPGRGPANAVVTLLNAHRLTGEGRFLGKAEELVKRVVHPDDDLDALALLDTERRWSYTVLLQALGRCLATRPQTGRRDSLREYARASLLHYARWMATHEYLYLEKPGHLEFPTETWAAQDVRKAEVFDLAAYYASTDVERQRFLACARDFHRRSLEMLASMPTRTRTRPVVLLLSNGFSRSWFERQTPHAPLELDQAQPWPPPSRFVPQKAIAMRRLKGLALAMAAVGAAVAATWLFQRV